VFWVTSVYFNIRNTLLKSGTFLLGHPVCVCVCVRACVRVCKFWFAADYTGCLSLAPDVCTVHHATEWTVRNTPNCTVLVP